MIITMRDWDQWQKQSDGKTRTWLKLHRSLRQYRKWRDLSGDAAKLLMDLWTLTDHATGTVETTLEDLAWELRTDPEALDMNILELVGAGWLARAPASAHARASCARTRGAPALEVERDKAIGRAPQGRSSSAVHKLAPAARERHGPDLGPQRLVTDPDTVH